MKKDRNTFFQEAQMGAQNYYPGPNLMSANGPYQASQASQSFYAGPYPNQTMYNPNSNSNDLESRLAKMERQINRLESRVNKLESMTTYTNDAYDTTSNMYMV